MARVPKRLLRTLFLTLTLTSILLLAGSLLPTLAPTPTPPVPSHPGRIFIASNHWNSAHILPTWSATVLTLIDHLGADNVYFSLYESGSWDTTKSHLRNLDSELARRGVPRTIILDDRTHADELANPPTSPIPGWIRAPDDSLELRRIPYLASLRNRVLDPLVTLNTTFDKLLFLNDVVFTAYDALTLLDTRSGDHAAACSLDFRYPPSFYDTFALRDTKGRAAATQRFPFFAPGASRSALLRLDPVPVKSCWNGMVSFAAEPFLPPQNLRFRGIGDELAGWHLEGSECCLIHYDNMAEGGVWVNPKVRVGYTKEAYEEVREWPGGWDRAVGRVVGAWTAVAGLPWTDGKVRKRMKEWEGTEAGEECLIDEMQVLRENGWGHL